MAKAPPFATANDRPTTPVESEDDRDGTAAPSPSPSAASAPTAEEGRAGLPATPVQIMDDSGTESDKIKELEPEEDSSYSAQVFLSTSDHALRKQTRGKSDGSKDSQDRAPSPKSVTVKRKRLMIMRVHPQLDYLMKLSVTIGLQSIAGILLQSTK